LIVLSIIFKSSTAYNKEKEGIAISNKTTQGTKVQTISKVVLCWIVVGKISKDNTLLFCLFIKNLPHKINPNSLKLKVPTTNSKIKNETKTTIQIIKNIIS